MHDPQGKESVETVVTEAPPPRWRGQDRGFSAPAVVPTGAYISRLSPSSRRPSVPRGGMTPRSSLRDSRTVSPTSQSMTTSRAQSPALEASQRFLPFLILLFVGSGCAALIYEVVWFQMLSLIVGSSAISLGVILG